jgi:hypothetical protein
MATFCHRTFFSIYICIPFGFVPVCGHYHPPIANAITPYFRRAIITNDNNNKRGGMIAVGA